MRNDKKNKVPKKAVALRYDQNKDTAPKIIAKGLNTLAEKIIELAKEQGIPIHSDNDLVEVLSRLNLNEEIPPDTYLLVAEILAFIYRTNKTFPK